MPVQSRSMEGSTRPRGGCLFCLSKAKGPCQEHPPNAQIHDSELRAELATLKPGALSKRARAEGVDDEAT